MWDLPGPGIEPVSPALVGVFFTTAPPGKSQVSFSTVVITNSILQVRKLRLREVSVPKGREQFGGARICIQISLTVVSACLFAFLHYIYDWRKANKTTVPKHSGLFRLPVEGSPVSSPRGGRHLPFPGNRPLSEAGSHQGVASSHCRG